MRSMFDGRGVAAGSNASNPSSTSAIKNWIAKNGLPAIFSWTNSANGRALRLAVERISDEPSNIVELKRRQHDLMHPRINRTDRLQRPQKRVRGTDLVVPISSDQQQVLHLRMRNQMLKEVERCCIQPLQIVEEQGERVLLPRKHPKEAPERHLETALHVVRRQVGDRRLLSDHELQLGNEIHDELTIWAQRLGEGLAPPAQLGLALSEERADKALECLAQRRGRDVALVLVELAGREQDTRWDERLVQLGHNRELADPELY